MSTTKHISHKKLILVMILVGALHAAAAYSQNIGGRNIGPCPRGSAPVGGTCGSPSNAYPAGSAQRPEVWINYYGALAATANGDMVGTANNQKSMRAAKKLAMGKCTKVKSGCKIVLEYRNRCASVAFGPIINGGGYLRAYGGGGSAFEADQKALNICKEGTGGGECIIDFTGCSLPVRVQ